MFLEFDGKDKYEKLREEGESVVDAVLREKKREETDLPAHGLAVHPDHLGRPLPPGGDVAYIRGVFAGGPVH